ncbi:MAG: TOMM precursor leader peptide-binding protein [bacterium]|nr:TOMM precursor leader peptide-binding protein [bacterium]
MNVKIKSIEENMKSKHLLKSIHKIQKEHAYEKSPLTWKNGDALQEESGDTPVITTIKRLKYCFRAEFVAEDKELLLSENNSTLITGKIYCDILRFLSEGGCTMDRLIAHMESEYAPYRIHAAFDKLAAEGFITDESASCGQVESAYWNSLGMHTGRLAKILEENPISIEYLEGGTFEIPGEAIYHAFCGIGLRVLPGSSLRVIVAQDYEQNQLRQINREALETGRPWVLCKPQGIEIWSGPLFIPGETGCWECLLQRLKNNRQINTFSRKQANRAAPLLSPAAALPVTIQIAAGLTALEIVKWLYFKKGSGIAGNIFTFDTGGGSTGRHTLIKRPQCPACGKRGDKKKKSPVPVVLKKTGPILSTMGGYRDSPPEKTVEKYKHHVSPITGVVQWLKPYRPTVDAPVYNYSSGLNMALRSKNLFWLNYHIRGANGGKGRNKTQAKAGALCEAIERYCCTYHGDEFYITASLKELGKRGIHPNACMNYSREQFIHREEINRESEKFYLLVPRPFEETLEMHWTPVYSMTRHCFNYLPSALCYAQYPAEDDYRLFAYPDSNGCAAGNSMEEAILQGFLELVERDGIAIWWYNRLRKPTLDLYSFNEPYFVQLIEYYKTLQREIYILDLTTDLPIYVFAAVSFRKGYQKEEIIFGFGAHVDAKIAVERALLEVNQLLPIVQVSEEERKAGRYRTRDTSFINWLKKAGRKNQPYLKPIENAPAKKASDYPRLCPPTIYDSLIYCINCAAEKGLDTLVLDTTRPDVGLHTVKVFVPGLRHFWKRLAPGRLYDVPVDMGWLRRPHNENEMNPIGIFI